MEHGTHCEGVVKALVEKGGKFAKERMFSFLKVVITKGERE
jgi:hypothetical protein